MKDSNTTKEQLIKELAEMRQRIAELERVVTAQKKVEQALKESEAKWRSLTENTPNIILTVARDGTIQFLNRTVGKYTPEQTIGTSVYDYVPPDQHHIMRNSIEKVFRTGKPDSYEIFGAGPQGPNTAWYETHIGPVIHGGKVSAVTMVSTDITERKRTEKKLQKSEERYRTLIENQGEGIGIVDVEECFTFANPAAHEIFGVPQGELVSRNLREFVDAETFALIRSQTEARRAGKKSTYEIEFNRLDGERRHLLVTATPRFSDDGQFIGTFGIFLDITERKKAETELRRYKTLVNTANALIMAHDDNWRVTIMNPYACKVLGYEVGEMLGKDIRQMLEKSECDRAEPVRQKVRIDPNTSVEGFEQYYWKKGKKERVLISWNVCAVRDVDGKAIGIQGVGQDITERKRMEEELKRHTQLLEISERNLKQFSRKILSVREEEKRMLATNLHDEVGSMAVALTSGLDIIEHEIKNNNLRAALESLLKIKNTVKRQIRIFKDIALDVHPPDLDTIGLPDALRTYFSNITKKAKIKIDFSVGVGEQRISDNVAIALYRIAQEALSNALIHANAKKVKVSLYSQKGDIKLNIYDDGKGFDIKKTLNQPEIQGIGIRGMLERTEYLDGRFVIESAPGKGTEIRVSIPNKE